MRMLALSMYEPKYQILRKTIQSYYKCWKAKNDNFLGQIDDLNKFFNCNENTEFLKEIPPAFYSGHIEDDKPKLVVIGINPHYSSEVDEEYKRMKRSYQSYEETKQGVSDFLISNKWHSRYWDNWKSLFGKRGEEILQTHIVAANIIPFYFRRFRTGYKSGTLEHLNNYIELLIMLLDVLGDRVRAILVTGRLGLEVLLRLQQFRFYQFKVTKASKEIACGTYKERVKV